MPNISKFSNSKRELIGSLMKLQISLKKTQDESGKANILGVPIQISRADTRKINENIYDLTPEMYKALSSTSDTGKTMKNEDDVLLMYNFIRDLGYTGRGGKQTNRKTFFTITLPKLVVEFQKKFFVETPGDSGDLQGEGVKIIIPSNVIDIYTRLEILLTLKFFRSY